VLLAIYKIAPALAAGNTVVIKPSEHTSASLLHVMRLVEEAGFPPGVVNVVTGGAVPGAALAEHPGVNKVSFTGGTSTGRAVAQAAAGHFVNASLELGGKSPQLVFGDADPAQASRGIVSGIFAAAGQTCIAGSRALVHASLYDEMVERIVDLAGSIRLGDPMLEETDMGPLCYESHRQRVEGIVVEAQQSGASILFGGTSPTPEHPGWFYPPTIIADANPDMRVCREEVFGPVLTVFRWEDEQQVIASANSTEYGLAAGVWTRDVARAHTVAAALDAGTVWVNKYRTGSPIVPIGGFKASGTSKENGRMVMDQYTRTKAVWINTSDEASGDLFVLQK
jgi:acyl-CoA reductase-like NAD-dependent aldehyde dehydrogenase